MRQNGQRDILYHVVTCRTIKAGVKEEERGFWSNGIHLPRKPIWVMSPESGQTSACSWEVVKKIPCFALLVHTRIISCPFTFPILFSHSTLGEYMSGYVVLRCLSGSKYNNKACDFFIFFVHFKMLSFMLCSFIVTMMQFYKTLQIDIQLLICFARLYDKKMFQRDK